MRTPRTVTALDLERIETAQDLLGNAASYLQDAGATRAVETVRRAQKSIGGAIRHATRLHRIHLEHDRNAAPGLNYRSHWTPLDGTHDLNKPTHDTKEQSR